MGRRRPENDRASIQFGDPKYLQIVRQAVNLYDPGNEPVLSGVNIMLFESLVDVLQDAFPVIPLIHGASREEITYSIERLLQAVRKEPDPAAEFMIRATQAIADLKSKPGFPHKVAFPLNFRTALRSLSIFDLKLEQISYEKWIADYEEPARQKSDLDTLLQTLTTEPTLSMSYWEATVAARDSAFVFHYLNERLDILLGQLNYCALKGSLWPWRQGIVAISPRLSELRNPFLYILRGPDEPRVAYDSLNSPQTWEWSDHHSKKVERHLPELPTLLENDRYDQHLAAAFRSYQEAVTAGEDRHVFLAFWRGLENLVSADAEGTNATIGRRGSASVKHPLGEEFRNLKAAQLIRKRNDLVHRGTGVEITKSEKELLKLWLEYTLGTALGFRTKLTMGELQDLLELRSLTDEPLEKEIERRSRGVQIANELMEQRKRRKGQIT